MIPSHLLNRLRHTTSCAHGPNRAIRREIDVRALSWDDVYLPSSFLKSRNVRKRVKRNDLSCQHSFSISILALWVRSTYLYM